MCWNAGLGRVCKAPFVHAVYLVDGLLLDTHSMPCCTVQSITSKPRNILALACADPRHHSPTP